MSKRKVEELPFGRTKKLQNNPKRRDESSFGKESGLRSSNPGSFFDKDYDSGGEDGVKSESGSEENRDVQSEAEENLDDETREILGVDPLASKALDIKFHPSVLRRGKFWYENGLPKEESENILEKYGTPVGVVVPELNREVEKKLPSHAKTRDSLMLKRQRLAAAAFKANGWLLSTCIENKEGVDRLECLERLTDVMKLIAEIMNSQTKSRRALILGGLDK
ncbi:uncharacterized protein LOC100679328 [Nasonia vitripennis]|uniref:Uncharacterized protein n=1 Tax=Nasonia vitripennis TaxID=7425 RepID=A0A7M7ITV0_NASVI|nr:uncharacterized protein LOC100679328 [Nasonia vitripennis]